MPDDFDEAMAEGGDAAPEPEETDAGTEAFEEEAEAAPAEPAGEEATEEAEAPEEQPPAEPWRASLRPGETPEQAVPRLVGHIQRYKSDNERLEERIAAMEPKFAAAEKILQRIQEREHMADLARREAELPDPDLEPERAALAEVQRLRQAIEEDRRQRQETEQRQLTEAEQRQRQEAVQAVDTWATNEILVGLGQVEGSEPDPEFTDAFQCQETMRVQAIRSEYADELAALPPEEAQAKVTQALDLMRRIDGRKAAAVGKNVRDLVMARHRALPEPVRRAMKEHLASMAAGTNGQPKPAGRKGGKPTAQQIEAEASKAARGAGVRRTTGGGGVAAPMSLDDFANLSEAEQARLIEAGKLSEEDLWAGLSDPDYGSGV